MKKLLYILFALGAGLFIAACSNVDEDKVDYSKYYEWRDKNNEIMYRITQYQKSMGQNAYFGDSIRSLSEPLSYKCFYRVISSANKDSLEKIGKWYTPFYTSTLKMHYTLYDPKSVMKKLPIDDASFNDSAVMDRIFFDGNNKADTIESKQVEFFEDFTCASVITGWGDVLQHMHIGDSWLVCIPWYLAYGQAGNSNIDPYSNLYFRMQLVDIKNLGMNIPIDN